MGREHARFVRHTELVERFDGVTHRVPIRFASHYDGDESGRFFWRHNEISREANSFPYRIQNEDVDLFNLGLRRHIVT